MKKNLIISFSGGLTSAFMARYLMLSEKYKDYNKIVLFANTGKEREETLEFVKQCDDAFGLNVVWLEAVIDPRKGKGTKHKIVNFETAARNGEPFIEVIKKYGIPNKKFIHCTRELKLRPMESYIKSLNLKNNFVTSIGIRADETVRINWKNAKEERKIYPLATEIRVDKMTVRRFWEKQPFNLKLKDYQGNCDFCYKKSTRKLLTLIKEDRTAFDWWIEQETKHADGNSFFRENKTGLDLVKMSEGRFNLAVDEFEEEKQKKQMSIFGNTADEFSNLDIGAGCFCAE
jgi:hypothetical protein